MLPVTDYLSDLPENVNETDIVEVQFKNTRKGYFHNSNQLPLEKGKVVVVEANPGYDIGEVVLTGRLCCARCTRTVSTLPDTRYVTCCVSPRRRTSRRLKRRG
jgi:hypothetical protein